MSMHARTLVAAALSLCLASPVLSQGPLLPPGDKEPVMRTEPGGPTSLVTAITFSSDGKRLYAAGFDKVVRVWVAGGDGKFALDKAAYRVPIGPGIDGTINAVALSPDEKWLAVAGQGIVRGAADFRVPGLILPKTGGFNKSMWEDQGLIYLFSTQDQSVKLLRGHMGPVFALVFAPAADGKGMTLVSAGRDRDMLNSKYRGAVRVWDVNKGGEAIAARLDLPETLIRPGLAAWHTGKKADQVRVAVAWNDGILRVWDVASDTVATARDGYNGTADGRLNITALYLPEKQQLLTTVLRLYADEDTAAAAQMRLWDVKGARPVSLKAKSFKATEGLEPVALALVSSKPGQATDYAAIAVRKRTRDEDTIRLVLADIAVEQFGTIAVSRDLWPTRGKLPVLAGVAGGRFLAAGGNPYHSIRAYSVADLLANGDKAEAQAFKGVGKTWGFVAFVTKGKDRGLLLNNTVLQPNRGKKPVSPDEGNAIFNLNQRVFTDNMAGWKIDSPAGGGVELEATPIKRDAKGVTVERAGVTVTPADGGAATRIRLPAGESVTDYAYLPAMAPLNVPLVAIASHELDQPMLRLYHARTGEQVRQYTGHQYKISSIAFSADGRLLASVADDQTICVWSLAKLEKYLGVLGNLPETAFRNQIVVKSVAAGGPAAGKLAAYDHIEGVIDAEGKLHRFTALRGLYRRLTEAKPGAKVVLQVKTEKDETKKVEIEVSTALVERNRALLVGLGVQNPLGFAGLVEASTFYSPLPGIALQYAPTVALTPAKSELTKGDVIEGIDQNKKLRPMATARDLYEAIAGTKPGSTLQLRVRGKGNVGAPVGQGSDERKPLFTIFTTGGGAPATWDWVGWNPVGPFETSGRRAEQYVGWHFNTGDAAAPAAFALIDQYRKEYYRDGILNYLVNRGDLAPALKDWSDQRKGEALPRPKMTMYAEEVPDPDKRNGLGQVVVRQLPVTVKLAVNDFPPEMLDSVQWQVDGGPLENFPIGVSARERGVDLALPRGVHTIRAVVKTREASPQIYFNDLVVKVVPPAPVVQALAAPRQVNAVALPWASKVQQGRADQPVRVRLAQMHEGKEVHSKIWDIKAGAAEQILDVSDKLELKPGDNEVEIVAVNTDAAKDDAGLETDRRRWVITYVPPEVKVAPARITLQRVATGSLKEPDVQSVEPGKPLVVRSEVVRVYGTIEADEPLSEAGWGQSDRLVPQPLNGFKTEKKIGFVQLLKVKPGSQTLVFTAKSPKSEVTRMELKLDYHPALPRLSLRGSDRPIYGDPAVPEPKASITGNYFSQSPIPFEATLLVNDREAGPAPTDQLEWTRAVVLAGKPIPVDNRIQVRLKSTYETYTTEPVTVRYLRPPHDIRFDGAAPPKELHSKNLLVDLTAHVKSHLPLVRESLEVEVNGREVPSAEFLPRDGDAWGIRVRNLPLEPNKKNVVKLWVSNPEARCQKAGEVVVVYDPPPTVKKPPTPAEVTIVEPAQNVNVTDADVQVRFRVKTESALKRVEIVREGQNEKEERTTINVADLKPDDQGMIDVRQAVKVTPGVNRVRVVAVNDGGEREAAAVVNLPHMPVRMVIDEIIPEGGGDPIKPKVLPEGRIDFSEVPQGQVQIRGRVLWNKEDDENLKKISMVKIYVNGFQQLPAALRSPKGGSREREFTARVVLNRSQGNNIEIELPDLKQDHGNRHQRQFALNCAKPVPGQRLHLLVVGIGKDNNKGLVDEALAAVNAKADRDGILRSPAFSQVRVYGPLTKFVKPEDVYTQMNLIKKTIELLASKDTPNDVVMVYYKGDETVQQQGNYFATSVTEFDDDLKNSGITYKGLQDCLRETLGAKVLMLDVARESEGMRAKDEVVQAKDTTNTYFSVLRYQWQKESSTRREGELMKDWRTALGSAKVEVLKTAALQIAAMLEKGSGGDRAAFDRHVPIGLGDLLVSKKSPQ